MERFSKEFDKERPKLFNFIKSRVKTAEEAEDVLQDIFLRGLLNLNSVESLSSITSWLYVTAKNRIIDLFRKKRELTESDYLGMDLTLEELVEDSGIGIEDDITRKWVMEEIERAIQELPRSQRDVYIFHEFDGLSYKEIAEITGDSVNTLLSRKRYAVISLREKLEDLYYEINEEY